MRVRVRVPHGIYLNAVFAVLKLNVLFVRTFLSSNSSIHCTINRQTKPQQTLCAPQTHTQMHTNLPAGIEKETTYSQSHELTLSAPKLPPDHQNNSLKDTDKLAITNSVQLVAQSLLCFFGNLLAKQKFLIFFFCFHNI